MLAIKPILNYNNIEILFNKKAQNKENQVKSTSFKGYKPDAVNKTIINEISSLIKSEATKRIAILAHKNPDPDAIGSMIGLKKIIYKATGKNPDAFVLNPLFDRLNHIQAKQNIISIVDDLSQDRLSLSAENIRKKFGDYDLVLAVDTSDRKMFDEVLFNSIFSNSKNSVKIDHHKIDKNRLEESNYAKINFVDSTKESASQLVMQLVNTLGLKKNNITSEISDPLLTGLISDSGNFKFAKGKAIFKDTGELVQTSNINNIFDEMSKVSLNNFNLGTFIRKKIKFENNGKIAYFMLDTADINFTTLKGGIKSVLFDLLKVKNVEYIFSIVKNSKDKNFGIVVNMRSKTNAVNQIANSYGGGGHEKACGFTTHGISPEKLKKVLLKKLNEIESK